MLLESPTSTENIGRDLGWGIQYLLLTTIAPPTPSLFSEEGGLDRGSGTSASCRAVAGTRWPR